MATVNLDDLVSTLEWVSTDFLDNQAYVCRDTGKIYWISGEAGVIDEEEIPGDIDDSDKYVPVPDKRDLDLGSYLVFDLLRNSCRNTIMKCATCFAAKGLTGASRACWNDRTRRRRGTRSVMRSR